MTPGFLQTEVNIFFVVIHLITATIKSIDIERVGTPIIITIMQISHLLFLERAIGDKWNRIVPEHGVNKMSYTVHRYASIFLSGRQHAAYTLRSVEVEANIIQCFLYFVKRRHFFVQYFVKLYKA